MAAHREPQGTEVLVFTFRGNETVLHLPFLKNRLFATEVVRSSWCSKSWLTCPVLALWKNMRKLPPGSQPFKHIHAGQTLLVLRELLTELNVEHAMVYRFAISDGVTLRI